MTAPVRRSVAAALTAAGLCLAAPATALAGFGYIREWGVQGSQNVAGQFFRPEAIAISPPPDNRVFVADTGNQRIQRFNRDGSGGTIIVDEQGDDPGELQEPLGIAVDQGKVYVADLDGMQVYDYDGNFLDEFGTVNGFGDGELNVPYSVSVDRAQNGLVYVADYYNHRIAEFEKDGDWVRNVGANGGDGSSGTGVGEFYHPVGVQFDAGRVWVTEEVKNRITGMTPDASSKGAFNVEGLGNPKELAPVGDGQSLWITDFLFESPRIFKEGHDGISPFGELVGDVPGGAGRFAAKGVATDADRNLYIVDIEGGVADDRVIVYGERPDPVPGSSGVPAGGTAPGTTPSTVDLKKPIVGGIRDGLIYTQDVLQQRGISIRVKPDEDSFFSGGASIPRVTGAGGNSRAAKTVRLKLKERLVRAGRTGTLKFPLPRRDRSAIRSALRRKRLTAKVTLDVRDLAGNRVRFRLKVRLKRPRR